MNKEPFFTIITPTYNRAYTIKKVITSVLSQSFSDFEYLIIDDGSTDNTKEVVDSFNDERIIYLKSEKNSGGHFVPRNIGISAAKGRYVIMIDSDDEMAENTLIILKKWADDCPDVGMFFLDAVYSGTGKIIGRFHRCIRKEDKCLKIFYKDIICAPHTGDHLDCIKRKIIGDLRFPENVKRNTHIFYHKLARKSEFLYVPIVGLKCFVDSADRVTKNIERDANEWIIGTDEYLKIFEGDIKKYKPKHLETWYRSRGVLCVLAGRRKEGILDLLKGLKYNHFSLYSWIYFVIAIFFPKLIKWKTNK